MAEVISSCNIKNDISYDVVGGKPMMKDVLRSYYMLRKAAQCLAYDIHNSTRNHNDFFDGLAIEIFFSL